MGGRRVRHSQNVCWGISGRVKSLSGNDNVIRLVREVANDSSTAKIDRRLKANDLHTRSNYIIGYKTLGIVVGLAGGQERKSSDREASI